MRLPKRASRFQPNVNGSDLNSNHNVKYCLHFDFQTTKENNTNNDIFHE